MLTRLSRISLFLFLIPPTITLAAEEILNTPSAFVSLSQQKRVNNTCLSIGKKLSSVTFNECIKRNLNAPNIQTLKQNNLLIKEYPPILSKRQPQAKILMLGGIHGDEYSSVTIMFKWMKILDKYHSGLFHWKVAPLVNPDGLLQKKSQRINANGVDLNRNFPNNGNSQINFQANSHANSHASPQANPQANPQASLDYWKNRAYSDPRRFPGASPASEIETRWIIQLIEEFKPDAIVAVHAPFGIVDYDGPTTPPSKLGSLYLKLLGTYPGSLGNYAGLQQNIPVVTIELPYAGIMPSDQEIIRIWVDMVRWLRKNVSAKSDS